MWRIAAAGGLSAALAVAQFLVPIAGTALSLFAPVPLLWLVWQAGGGQGGRRWHAAAAALLAAALPVLLVGPDLALGLLVQFGPMTAGLALGLARSWSITATVAEAAGLTVAIGFAALLVRSSFDPAAAEQAVVEQVERAVTAALVRTAGGAVEPEPLVAVFVRLLPGLVVTGTAAGAWVNLFVLRWGVTGGWRPRRRGHPKEPGEEAPAGDEAGEGAEGAVTPGGLAEAGAGEPPDDGLPDGERRDVGPGHGEPDGDAGRPDDRERPLPAHPPGTRSIGPIPEGYRGRPPLDDWSRWSAPEPLVFVLILGGAALLLGMPAATTVGLNLLLVVVFVYFLQGLAIVGFFFRAKRVPMALRIAGYLLIGAQQLLALAVAAVGLADLWIDFRRRAVRLPR